MSRTKPTRCSDEVVRKALELRASGKSYGELSRELGQPYYMIVQWCQYRTQQAARCAG